MAGYADGQAQHFANTIKIGAAQLVNQKWNETGHRVTDPVSPGHWHGGTGPFTFEFNHEQGMQLTDEEKDQVREMCKEAVKQMIVDNAGQDLAALIVGHARQGENFFDYFR